ncbi:hypothetical protein LWP59_25370 [Amycolatopsis acidiphila]|uniref:Uncharacterized protein n=1 Tax=Amycolatopsis acidiphila TaxID=715473 RepID=A0A558AL88_9PSEU|nr:hypothetical protein [Amycolatopsis acidiphila]TVT25025.1 hypothetical protein FNH06_04185 [Amycolatopsis acidiphila]UIJ57466.1 hypothetical protein LWP59_25370 [Amycolatopsis acidiphila]
MRIVDHQGTDGPDKILHVRAVGCDVNIIVGTHDPHGVPFTTVEVLPHEPDDDGVNWLHLGTASVVVMPVPHATTLDGEARR